MKIEGNLTLGDNGTVTIDGVVYDLTPRPDPVCPFEIGSWVTHKDGGWGVSFKVVEWDARKRMVGIRYAGPTYYYFPEILKSVPAPLPPEPPEYIKVGTFNEG